METSSIIEKKTYDFANRILKLYKYLIDNKAPFPLANQILRSGTSIGANVAESRYASSKADFISKTYISLKECNETLYWISLLGDNGYISEEARKSLIKDCQELKYMLTARSKTAKGLSKIFSINAVEDDSLDNDG